MDQNNKQEMIADYFNQNNIYITVVFLNITSINNKKVVYPFHSILCHLLNKSGYCQLAANS